MQSNSIRLFVLTFCVLFLFACTKANAKDAKKNKTEFENSSNKIIEEKIPEDVQKFYSVYDLMSERFKNDFALTKDSEISEIQNFLADLKTVLDEEKKYTQDDLSLYYLIDKKHNAGSSYAPKDLVDLKSNNYFLVNKNGMQIRADAYDALVVLSKAALNDGITLLVSSAYRSYAYQERVFNYWVSVDGLEEAERESARPGTSQHQLGCAVDFGSISDDFAETEMGQWVYKNAAKYGWSLSFPKRYEDVTGYRWECWHFRYIGKPACEFQKKYFNDIQQFMLEFIHCW